MTRVINPNTDNTLNNKCIMSTELYNKILKAMDDGQIIVFHGKLTNYESFQYAIATPFVALPPSSDISFPIINLEIRYVTIDTSGKNFFTITSVSFLVGPNPMEEVELYEPQNFDILDLSSGGGEK